LNLFCYKDGKELFCEDVKLAEIAASFGTPAYVYSSGTLKQHFKVFDEAFSKIPHITCFSIKSNSNLSIIRLFLSLGGGLDIVSGGELYRSLRAGADPSRIVFSGVGKQKWEMEMAIQAGILMFNVESHDELLSLNETAGKIGRKAPVSFRVNPDVDPRTHPYLATGLRKSKFGIPIARAFEEYLFASKLPNLEIIGVDCHIGSQLTSVEPFVDAVKRVKAFIKRLREAGIHINYLDIGGGLGITYDQETPPHPAVYAAELLKELADEELKIIFEPGRVLVGNAGVLLTKVLYLKENGDKNFIIVDAAMNDLIRPSIYGAFHQIKPVRISNGTKIKADVVGPICESGDFFAKDREIDSVECGDLLAVMSSGAYGFSMSSNYNSRLRAAEVLVDGGQCSLIRKRETLGDLVRGEE